MVSEGVADWVSGLRVVFRSKRFVVKLYFDRNDVLEHAFALDREGLVALTPLSKSAEVWVCLDADTSVFENHIDGFLDYWSKVLSQLEDVDVVIE